MSATFLWTFVLLSALSYNLTTATVHCDYYTYLCNLYNSSPPKLCLKVAVHKICNIFQYNFKHYTEFRKIKAPQNSDNRQNFNLLQHNLYEFYCVTIITPVMYDIFKILLINAPEWFVKMTKSLSILNAHNRANTTDNNKVTCMMASHPQPAYNFLEVPFNLLFRDPSERKEAQMQNNENATDAVQQQQRPLLIWLSWSMQVEVTCGNGIEREG